VTAAGHFRRIEVWSDLQCAGGTRLAVLRDPIVLEPTYDLTGDESLSLRLSRSSPSYAALTERRVLRIVRKAAGAETWEEWRVSGRGESSGFTSPPSDFSGRPVRFDLGDVILRQSFNDGTTGFRFSFTGLTLAEAFDAYLLPQLSPRLAKATGTAALSTRARRSMTRSQTAPCSRCCASGRIASASSSPNGRTAPAGT
jgi:hypothetical protein